MRVHRAKPPAWGQVIPAPSLFPKRLDDDALGPSGSAHLTSIESFALIGLERRFPARTRSAISRHLEYHKQAWLRIRLPRLHLFGQIFQEELEQKLLMLVGNEEKPYSAFGIRPREIRG